MAAKRGRISKTPWRNVARVGAQMAYKYASEYVKTKGRSAAAPQPGITTQYDRAVIYRARTRRRRYPKRRRRFQRSVRRIVNKQAFSRIGTKTVLFNDSQVIPGSGNNTNNNAVGCVHLMGTNGDLAQPDGRSDLTQVMNYEIADYSVGGGAAGALRSQTLRCYFRSAVLDWTLRNSTTGVSQECDVYVCRFTKSVDVVSLLNLYQTADTNTRVMTGGTSLSLATRGVTPFEFPWASRFAKILSKTKYFLAPGQTITGQYKIKKPYVYKSEVMAQTGTGEIRPPTIGVLIVSKPVAGTTWALESGTAITWASSRVYRYKVIPFQESRDRLP